MDLTFIFLFTISLLKPCVCTPAKILSDQTQRSGGTDLLHDVFGDILTSNQGSSKFMIQGDIAVKRSRNALSCPKNSCLWPTSGDGLVLVPYSLSNNYTSSEKDIILAALEEVMVLTCIRFVPRNKEPDYLRIRPYDGCWSYIGRVGGAQDVSLMKTGCLHRGIIQHELLHSLGFQHEQCRSDRDKYIRIIWENISQDKERNFYKMSTQNLGMPYDYLSVLHYGKFAFASDAGKPTLEPTGNPSALIDICSYLLPDPHNSFSWESRLHPNTSTCVWLIRVPEGKVFLQFETFSIPSSPSCVHGFVMVYDGPSTKSPILLPKTCGKVRPLVQVSSGTLMRVEVASSGNGVSFRAVYNSVQCGGSHNSPEGNFSTLNFPASYPNSMDCVWTLLAPLGNKIQLRFSPFSLEFSPGCSHDFILIHDGRRQRKKCGRFPQLDFKSYGRSMVIYFHSDGLIQGDGFSATYSFFPAS